MGSYSVLLASKSPEVANNPDFRTIASMKYGMAVGWMFLFADSDRIPYRPEGYSEDLFFYRTQVENARLRLGEAVAALSGDPYLWSRLRSLEKLKASLDRASEPWVIFDFEEIIAMGWGAKKTLAGLLRAPTVLSRAVRMAQDKRFHAVRESINELKGIGGFKLHGSPWLDHLWWWIDRKVTGIKDDQELSDHYVAGVLEVSP